MNNIKMVDYYRQLSSRNFEIKDNKAFMFNWGYGGIAEICLTGNTEPHLIWLDERKNFINKCQYSGCACFGNKLIFAPWMAREILIFDTRSQDVTYVPFDYRRTGNDRFHNLFSDVMVYEDSAYFFPGRMNCIIKLDLKDLKVTYIDNYVSSIGNMPYLNSVTFSIVRKKDVKTALLVCFQKGIMLEFDMETGRFYTQKISEKPFYDICYMDSVYWCTYRHRPELVRFNALEGEIRSFDISKTCYHNTDGYMFVSALGKQLLLIPQRGESAILFNPEHLSTELFYRWDMGKDSFNSALCDINRFGIKSFYCTQNNGNNYFFDSITGDLISVLTDGMVKRINLQISDSELNSVKKHYVKLCKKERLLMQETKQFNLEGLIEAL